MSVINHMLRDLERRGGHQATGAGPLPPVVAPPRRRWRPRLPATAALAVALGVVAAALWLERGPAVAEQLRYHFNGGGDESAPLPVALIATEPPADAGERLAAAADPLAGELTGLEFEDDGAGAASLVLVFRDEPPPVALPATHGDALRLRLPAHAGDLDVPAPPAGAAPFTGLGLAAVDPGSALEVGLADAERVQLERVDDRRLALRAEVADGVNASAATQADTAEAEGSDEPTADASAESDAAAADGEAAAGTEGDAASEPEADAGTATAAGDVDTDAEHATGTDTGAETGADSAAAIEADPAADTELVAEADNDSETAVRQETEASSEVRARRRYSDARDALAAGDVRAARGYLEEAVELDPALHSAREVLVALLRRAGDDDAARDVLAEGVEEAPARPSYAMPYARLLVDVDELDRARAVLEDARINAAGDLDFHALAANIERRREDHAAAIAEYTEALEIDATRSALWLGLALSLRAEEHRDEAAAAFREARDTGQLGADIERWVDRQIEALEERPEGEP